MRASVPRSTGRAAPRGTAQPRARPARRGLQVRREENCVFWQPDRHDGRRKKRAVALGPAAPFSRPHLPPHSHAFHTQVVARDYPRPNIDTSAPFQEAAALSAELASFAKPAKPLKVVIAGAGK